MKLTQFPVHKTG